MRILAQRIDLTTPDLVDMSRPIQGRNLVNNGPFPLNGGAIEPILGLGPTVRRISLKLVGTTVEGIVSK